LRRFGREALAQALRETRDSTWQVLDALEPAHWTVPRRDTLNPPLWEIGHVGWFQEYWCLRRAESGPPRAVRPSMLDHADRWFDSARVAHADRWTLDLPPLDRVREWLDAVLEACLAQLHTLPETDESLYWHRLALFHEQFHVEAFGYTWQALGYRQPGPRWNPPAPMRLGRDASLPGGTLELGSRPGDGFVFDNEQWAHPVEVGAFEVSLQPVTNAEFLQFVEDGGYRDATRWAPEAFARLRAEGREAPWGWRRVGPRWQRRWFDAWIPIEPYAPVVQVDAFEAEAWCAWAGRRLPTEVEWEYAALHCEDFEWGDTVWEWTASPFLPYPGFSPGPYRDYSQPWFGDHRVVRGGSFATQASLADPRLRNFYRPERGDFFVGFRSCALG
jgi:ergothioneine biosynthesis protein EgtB